MQINNIVGLAPGCYVVHDRHNVRVTEWSENYLAAIGLTDKEINDSGSTLRWRSQVLADCPIFLQADSVAYSIQYLLEAYKDLKEQGIDNPDVTADILDIHKYIAGIFNDVIGNKKICDVLINELMEVYHAEECVNE